jgi:hypothetical protein
LDVEISVDKGDARIVAFGAIDDDAATGEAAANPSSDRWPDEQLRALL